MAWDREYEIEANDEKKRVRIKSAELTNFQIDEFEGKPRICLSVDYAIPTEIPGNLRQIRDMKSDLESALLAHPILVISDCIMGKWPVHLNVSFSFGREQLKLCTFENGREKRKDVS